MRIIIDTDLQAIIVPDSYTTHVDRLNEVITEAGGQPLDYTSYIRTCFEKAYATKVIRLSEVAELKAERKATLHKPSLGANPDSQA